MKIGTSRLAARLRVASACSVDEVRRQARPCRQGAPDGAGPCTARSRRPARSRRARCARRSIAARLLARDQRLELRLRAAHAGEVRALVEIAVANVVPRRHHVVVVDRHRHLRRVRKQEAHAQRPRQSESPAPPATSRRRCRRGRAARSRRHRVRPRSRSRSAGRISLIGLPSRSCLVVNLRIVARLSSICVKKPEARNANRCYNSPAVRTHADGGRQMSVESAKQPHA